MGQIPHERIVSDPEIMMGKPTIKGTRITVELILEELGEGVSVEEVLCAHPHLKEQVLAALRFAADYMRNEDLAFGSPEAAAPTSASLRDRAALRNAGHEATTIAPRDAGATDEAVLGRVGAPACHPPYGG